jgi:glycosyltransferase involved in cell wall biosynthesis
MWRGIPVYPCTPYAEVGEDTVRPNYQDFNADVVFTLLCTWVLSYPQIWRDMRTVHINPVDCSPMSYADWSVIQATYGQPAAISQFGLEMLKQGREGQGFEPFYLPHGVDTKCFAPSPERMAIRRDMGIADSTFMVGMNFMNNDRWRKNVNEAIRGFAEFHVEHPDSMLWVHAMKALPEGIHVPRLAERLGISKAVTMTPQSQLVRGMITPPMLADLYNAFDVHLDIGNEGFGLTRVEAMACGTPCIVGNWSTGPELVGPGWLVDGQQMTNEKHQADWGLAHVGSVAARLGEAWEDARNRRADARDFAMSYEIGRQVRDHWVPVLGELQEGQ